MNWTLFLAALAPLSSLVSVLATLHLTRKKAHVDTQSVLVTDALQISDRKETEIERLSKQVNDQEEKIGVLEKANRLKQTEIDHLSDRLAVEVQAKTTLQQEVNILRQAYINLLQDYQMLATQVREIRLQVGLPSTTIPLAPSIGMDTNVQNP